MAIQNRSPVAECGNRVAKNVQTTDNWNKPSIVLKPLEYS